MGWEREIGLTTAWPPWEPQKLAYPGYPHIDTHTHTPPAHTYTSMKSETTFFSWLQINRDHTRSAHFLKLSLTTNSRVKLNTSSPVNTTQGQSLLGSVKPPRGSKLGINAVVKTQTKDYDSPKYFCQIFFVHDARSFVEFERRCFPYFVIKA